MTTVRNALSRARGISQMTAPGASCHGEPRHYLDGCRCKRCTAAHTAYRRGDIPITGRLCDTRIHAKPEDTWPGKPKGITS